MKYTTLKRPAEFRRVRGGVRWATPLFIIEGKARDGLGSARVATGATATGCGGPRFGFTITRKIGGAVVRNRIRRRLKEALRGLEPQCAAADFDYVVVASRAAHDYPFAELQDALRAALQRLDRAARGGSAKGDGGRSSRRGGAHGGSAAPRSGGPSPGAHDTRRRRTVPAADDNPADDMPQRDMPAADDRPAGRVPPATEPGGGRRR